jgi:hypothetical protein
MQRVSGPTGKYKEWIWQGDCKITPGNPACVRIQNTTVGWNEISGCNYVVATTELMTAHRQYALMTSRVRKHVGPRIPAFSVRYSSTTRLFLTYIITRRRCIDIFDMMLVHKHMSIFVDMCLRTSEIMDNHGHCLQNGKELVRFRNKTRCAYRDTSALYNADVSR